MTMNTRACRLLLLLLTGDPTESMEAAKRIIGLRSGFDPALLGEIASNKAYRKWSRIAAIYATGFLRHRSSGRHLIKILEDTSEHNQLRCHSAEALGNLRDPRAVESLARILKRKGDPVLASWCIYALSEIGTSQARRCLKDYEAQRPTGRVAKELKLALTRLQSN
jgi:HEAT repeats